MNELDRTERAFWRAYYRYPSQKGIVWCKENKLPLLLGWIEQFTKWSVIIKCDQKNKTHFNQDIPQVYLSQVQSFDRFSSWLKTSGEFSYECTRSSLETTGVLFEIHRPQIFDSIGLPDELLNNLLADALTNNIPDKMFLIGLHSYSDNRNLPCLLLKYSDRITQPQVSSTQRQLAVTACLQGFGDAILFYPLMKSFVDQKTIEGYRVHLYVFSLQAHSILELLLGDCVRIIGVPYVKSFDAVLKSGQYKNCYHVPFPRYAFGKVHIVDYWAKSLGVSASTAPCDISGISFPELPNPIKNAIHDFRNRNNKVVGFQHHSSSWAGRKSWSERQVRAFIKECRAEGIQLLNLSPHSYDNLEGITDISELSVIELFSVIRSVDAVVGIDSCVGHMASLCGIPNITIWVGNYPHARQDENGRIVGRVSFRPTFCNYSIASREVKPDDISSTIVVRRLRDLFEGNIVFSQDRITMEDTLQRKNVEYINKSESVYS